MKPTIEKRVRDHGELLKTVFGLPADTDPVNLCRKMRRLEAQGQALGLRLCNGPEFKEGEDDRIAEEILAKVDRWLGYKANDIPVFLNRDPRGYAIKIDDAWMREHQYCDSVRRFHKDFGGYGIIAPDLSA